MAVFIPSKPSHATRTSKIRLSVRCLSADLSQQELVGFAINAEAKLADLLMKAQSRVRSVPADDLVDLFYADCRGRLELDDLVGEVLTTDGLTLVAAATDAWIHLPPLHGSGGAAPDIETEQQDPVIGIRMVTAHHPPTDSSDMELVPGETVTVLKTDWQQEVGDVILCQNAAGNEAWFPADTVTPQEVLKEFQDCPDDDKDYLAVSVGEVVYQCRKENGWILCQVISGELGWVPDWAFQKVSSKSSQRRKPAEVKVEQLSGSKDKLPKSSKTKNRSDRFRSRSARRGGDDNIKGCIRKVVGTHAMLVDQLDLHMRDGTVKTFGDAGGDSTIQFRLETDELLTSVTQVERGLYLGASLTFTTSKGRTFEVKGWTCTGRKWHTNAFTAPEGEQICNLGFHGSKLSFVETLPANSKGNVRRIAIKAEDNSHDQSRQSASSGSQRHPVKR